mgnify:CR=1 FL=1
MPMHLRDTVYIPRFEYDAQVAFHDQVDLKLEQHKSVDVIIYAISEISGKDSLVNLSIEDTKVAPLAFDATRIAH